MAKTSSPTRTLAAIVFTDIVGYSALVHRDDANALKLVNEHFALVREIAKAHGGKVIKTIGDSVHLEFASAQAATMCAVAIQQRHQHRNASVAEPQRFDIRIGIHLGDVDHSGGDIYGDGVNIAARLQPLAPVGGIAISDHVRGQLREELRRRFTSRGPQDLKNIATPIDLLVIEADAIAEIEAAPAAPTASSPVTRRAFPLRAALAAAAVAVAIGLTVLWTRSPSPAPGATTSAVAAASDKSIAVLPFTNLSSDKEQEYFSDGIAEDLLNLLTKVETLQVAARTSSFSFKGKDVAIPEIAKALHVAHVLQGSVRKSGNQVRVTAQLVRAADGFQIWSQSWDRQLDDVFKIQDEIAQAVVEQLKVRLLGAVPTAKPVDPRVYPLILQAKALNDQQSAEGRVQAIATFQQALAIAPDEARAWSQLSRVYVNQVIFGERAAPEGARLAREAAKKALELDPRSAIALGVLGRVSADIDLDLPASARYFQRALEAEPGYVIPMIGAAALLGSIGRTEQAIQLSEYCAAHDAANPVVFHNWGFQLHVARRWDASIEASRTALRLSPISQTTHAQVGNALLLGKRDAAAALKEFEAEPDEVTRLVGRSQALHALGRTSEADAALKALIDQHGKDQPEYIATVYGHRGDADAAFDWLEKALAIRDPGLSTVLMEPFFDALHDDPRWIPYLRKIGYAPEQLAKIEFKVTLPASAPPER